MSLLLAHGVRMTPVVLGVQVDASRLNRGMLRISGRVISGFGGT